MRRCEWAGVLGEAARDGLLRSGEGEQVEEDKGDEGHNETSPGNESTGQ